MRNDRVRHPPQSQGRRAVAGVFWGMTPDRCGWGTRPKPGCGVVLADDRTHQEKGSQDGRPEAATHAAANGLDACRQRDPARPCHDARSGDDGHSPIVVAEVHPLRQTEEQIDTAEATSHQQRMIERDQQCSSTFRSYPSDVANSASANQTASQHVSTLRAVARQVLLLAAASVLTAAGGIAAPAPDAAPPSNSTPNSTIVVTAPPDIPVVPPAALGTNGDVDQAAFGIAGWAFADPGRTSGRPVEAARAVISLEYIASALSNNPRYIGTSPLVQQQLLAARQEVRDVLGVARGAPSQAVVDALIGLEERGHRRRRGGAGKGVVRSSVYPRREGNAPAHRLSAAAAGCQCGDATGPGRHQAAGSSLT